jgi:hypothetical protein
MTKLVGWWTFSDPTHFPSRLCQDKLGERQAQGVALSFHCKQNSSRRPFRTEDIIGAACSRSAQGLGCAVLFEYLAKSDFPPPPKLRNCGRKLIGGCCPVAMLLSGCKQSRPYRVRLPCHKNVKPVLHA